MKRRPRALRMAALAAGVLLFVFSSPSPADSPAPPEAYEIILGADDEYRFVMLAHEPFVNDDGTRYAVSGLYRNDGSTNPLWSVDWYDDSVRVTRDGRYLARLGPWPSEYDELAVGFYDYGVPIRSYKISDLIAEPEKLPRSVSHFTWRAEVAFDDLRGLLRVHTLDGQVLLFELATGRLVEDKSL